MLTRFHKAFTACAILLCWLVAAPVVAQDADAAPHRPRILLTNDDGIDSPALTALLTELRGFSDVVISAPATNQSGMGQAYTISHSNVRVNQMQDSSGVLRLRVYGTPADATLYALTSQPPFDLVISGINMGLNVGSISWISGTVGAARQAALLGTPAIAVSQEENAAGQYDFTIAARYVAQLARYAVARPERWPLLMSVNVPDAPTGVVQVRGETAWPRSYTAPRETGRDASGDPLYQISSTATAPQDKKGDRFALANHKITITLLTLDPNAKPKKLPLMLMSLPDAPK